MTINSPWERLMRLLQQPDDDGHIRATRVLYAKPDGRERLPRRDETPQEAA